MSDISTITFEIGNNTIQLCGDTALIWIGIPDHEADIELDIDDLRRMLSASSMLVKVEEGK